MDDEYIISMCSMARSHLSSEHEDNEEMVSMWFLHWFMCDNTFSKRDSSIDLSVWFLLTFSLTFFPKDQSYGFHLIGLNSTSICHLVRLEMVFLHNIKYYIGSACMESK